MAEDLKDMKGWMRESEFIAAQAKQNAADIVELKRQMGVCALILRDLVYIALTEGETEHQEVLLQHQETLGEMVGGGDE